MELLSYTYLSADTDLQKAWIWKKEKRVQQPEQSVFLCKRQSQSDGEHAVHMNIVLSTERQDFCPQQQHVHEQSRAKTCDQKTNKKKRPVYIWCLLSDVNRFLLRQCYPWSLLFSLERVLCWYLLFLSLYTGLLLCTKIKKNTSWKCEEFTGHVKDKKQVHRENIKKSSSWWQPGFFVSFSTTENIQSKMKMWLTETPSKQGATFQVCVWTSVLWQTSSNCCPEVGTCICKVSRKEEGISCKVIGMQWDEKPLEGCRRKALMTLKCLIGVLAVWARAESCALVVSCTGRPPDTESQPGLSSH